MAHIGFTIYRAGRDYSIKIIYAFASFITGQRNRIFFEVSAGVLQGDTLGP